MTERNTNSRVRHLPAARTAPHALQANLRRDDSSQYGGKTTGAIAYGYRFAPSLRVTAGGSTGFKAPSFNDLYFPDFSNPTLVPETSSNVEIGAYLYGTATAGGTWEARAIAYRNRVSQLIVLQCDANFNCVPHNVAARDARRRDARASTRRFGATTIAASLDLAVARGRVDRQAAAAARARSTAR